MALRGASSDARPGCGGLSPEGSQGTGPLRGVDYLMMREIAAVSESMVLTQTARSVRERVQGANGKAPGLAKREAIVDAGWTATAEHTAEHLDQ